LAVEKAKLVPLSLTSGLGRLDRKAIHLPSGDQCGALSTPALTMNGRATALPSDGTVQIV